MRAALWCIGISLGWIALTLSATTYRTYSTVAPVLESYRHGRLGNSINEIHDTLHRAHDMAEQIHPEHIAELWNASNALLARVPWEDLKSMSDDALNKLQQTAEDPRTLHLVQTVEQLLKHVERLPLDHFLSLVESWKR